MRGFSTNCPGCGRLVQAFNMKSLDRHMRRHAKDCAPLRRMAANALRLRPDIERKARPAGELE